MKRKLWMLVLIIMWAAPAHAGQPAAEMNAAPEPADFAYGMQISVKGEAPIYELALPEAVYRHAVRGDLGDMRVFNSRNEAVPHAILLPAKPVKQDPPADIPLFPIPEGLAADGKNISLNISTDSAGTIIDVKADGEVAGTEKASAWLLDLSGLKDRQPDRIVLEWADQAQNFNAAASVSGSHDLSGWRPLVRAASVAQLEFAGHRLVKDTIELPSVRMPYLKIDFPGGAAGPKLTGVKAHFAQEAQEHPRSWISVQGKTDKEEAGVWIFDSGGVFPVDRLDLELPEGNHLLQAVLRDRKKEGDAWRGRYNWLFYRLRVDGATLSSDPVQVPPGSGRLWQMEIVSESSGTAADPPVLKIGWLPHRLVFLARDNPPYTLAFGSAETEPPRTTVDLLFTKIDENTRAGMVKPASAGEMKVLGGPERLAPAPPPLPWKKWLLWAVLVSSVAVLAVMALRLFRQMER